MSTIIPYAPIPEGEYNIFVRQIGVKKSSGPCTVIRNNASVSICWYLKDPWIPSDFSVWLKGRRKSIQGRSNLRASAKWLTGIHGNLIQQKALGYLVARSPDACLRISGNHKLPDMEGDPYPFILYSWNWTVRQVHQKNCECFEMSTAYYQMSCIIYFSGLSLQFHCLSAILQLSEL